METVTFTTNETDAGLRLDKYLSVQMPEVTRSFLQKLIKEDYVTVEEKSVS